MSNWTYISGSIELSACPYKFYLDANNFLLRDGNGEAIHNLPYIAEQVKLDEKDENTVNIYSYPIVQKIINNNLHLLPNGITYYLNPSNEVSSSGLLREENPDHKVIIDQARILIKDTSRSFKRQNKITSSVLAINSLVRSNECDAEKMYDSIILFLKSLVNEDALPEQGVLSWWSDNASSKRYTLYLSNPEAIGYTYCEIYDLSTRKLKRDYYDYIDTDDVDRPWYHLEKREV